MTSPLLDFYCSLIRPYNYILTPRLDHIVFDTLPTTVRGGSLVRPSFFPACLASMFQILFSASIKNTWLASIFCFHHVLAKDYFDGPASIFCLASMFQILFCASLKTHGWPVYYCFIMYWQRYILVCQHNHI
jgi:hypothetical protein